VLYEGQTGVPLRSVAVTRPYTKDYDAVVGERAIDWAGRWDLACWWFAAAFLDGRRVGGVAVVMDTSQADGANSRPDEVILADIRVAPDCRRQGVGRRLIQFAESHARSAGKRWIKLETQDNNVAACRFYAAAGYSIRTLNRSAYRDLPDEVQLIWAKELLGPVGPAE
jgi:ribosomal protein S18 acetylase RimI-like enzyme